MPVKRASVFVSSAYVDLKEYRTKVRDVIRKLDAIDIAMAKLGAIDERSVDECLRLVKTESDLFVGICAHR